MFDFETNVFLLSERLEGARGRCQSASSMWHFGSTKMSLIGRGAQMEAELSVCRSCWARQRASWELRRHTCCRLSSGSLALEDFVFLCLVALSVFRLRLKYLYVFQAFMIPRGRIRLTLANPDSSCSATARLTSVVLSVSGRWWSVHPDNFSSSSLVCRADDIHT